MEIAREICNNVLVLVREYYDALISIEGIQTDIMYENDSVLFNDDNGSYIKYLKNCNLKDMRNIMYLCITTIPVKYISTPSFKLKSPRCAIKYAIKYLDSCITEKKIQLRDGDFIDFM